MLVSSLGICTCAVYPEHLAARVPSHHALRGRRGDRGIQSFIFRDGWWWFWLPGHVTKLNRVMVTWYSTFLQMPHIDEEVGMLLQYASFLFMCLRHELSELFFKQLVFNRSFLSAPNELCIFQSSFGVPFDNKRLRLTASATEMARKLRLRQPFRGWDTPFILLHCPWT